VVKYDGVATVEESLMPRGNPFQTAETNWAINMMQNYAYNKSTTIYMTNSTQNVH